MKNILILLILVCLGFVSCDGRKSKSEALKSSIEEFNKKQSEVSIVTYYPKDYVEVITDTLISNNLKVYIKNYSLLNQSLLISLDNEAVPKSKKEHRVFASDIVVSTPSKEILNTHISAEQFKSIFPDDFWDHATLEHVWVNQELSTPNNIKLDMSFINPSNNSYKLYRMSINENGQQQIDLIKERT
jgi:hypothetical protein